jgi:pSer/pThr/pTyr-binding forkhead associated (FHA) protein
VSELSLEVVEGADAGRRADLSSSLTVGRGRDVDLVLADELVSRRHARVSQSATGAVVEDLGSRNGTFVNGNQIFGPTRLEPGDQLQLGVTLVELRSARQIAERPSAVQPVPPPLARPAQAPAYLPADLEVDPASTPPGGGMSGRRRMPGHERRGMPGHELDPLLDSRTKAKARTAPLALFVLVVLVLIIYLATAR